MNNRYDGSVTSSLTNKKIFFDANILIYLYWSTSSEWENKYAKIYDDLNVPENDFIVDFLVISEFINRALRLDYDIYLDENGFNSREISFKGLTNSSAKIAPKGALIFVTRSGILQYRWSCLPCTSSVHINS